MPFNRPVRFRISSLCGIPGTNSVLFHLFGAPDKKNSEMMIANLYQGGLGLTDVDYYRDQDPKAQEIRDTYKTTLHRCLDSAGELTKRQPLMPN